MGFDEYLSVIDHTENDCDKKGIHKERIPLTVLNTKE